MKEINIIIILLLSGLLVTAQKKDNILIGSWKIVKLVSTDIHNPLTKEESKEGLGDVIIFKNDEIIIPKGKYASKSCSYPNYQFKVVNAMKYFENARWYLKLIGCKTKNIQIAETSCGVLFSNIKITNRNLIVIGMDNITIFLKKMK